MHYPMSGEAFDEDGEPEGGAKSERQEAEDAERKEGKWEDHHQHHHRETDDKLSKPCCSSDRSNDDKSTIMDSVEKIQTSETAAATTEAIFG